MLFSLLYFLSYCVSAWNIRQIAGIWKLETKELPHTEPTIVERALGHKVSQKNAVSEILLKLNEDGTFRQCNEGYVEGSWITGRWAVVGCKQLRFALNRQYYGPQFDIGMEGKVNRHKNYLIIEGMVSKGKWTLPRSDNLFFDRGLREKEVLGPFRMTQTIATILSSGSLVDGALIEGDDFFQ